MYTTHSYSRSELPIVWLLFEGGVYRITGNFGGGFNLAIWRLKSLSPKFKIAKLYT